MSALLDTDILSEVLGRRNPNVLARHAEYVKRHGRIAISALTAYEVIEGQHRADRADRAEAFRRWTSSRCRVIHFDLECARVAGEIGGALLRRGTPIGSMDVGIAATAMVHKRTLVTGNTKHYESVREAGFAIALENWRDAP